MEVFHSYTVVAATISYIVDGLWLTYSLLGKAKLGAELVHYRQLQANGVEEQTVTSLKTMP